MSEFEQTVMNWYRMH